MSIRTLATVAGVIALMGSLPGIVQAQSPTSPAESTPQATPKHRIVGSYYWQQGNPQETKPEPKQEAKTATAATLAGKWNVNLETGNGSMQSALDIKADPKDAKKVTGTIVSQVGEAPFEGEVVNGTLTFWFKMSANGTEISVTFTGTQQKDASLAGTLNFGQGDIPWTATKEKK